MPGIVDTRVPKPTRTLVGALLLLQVAGGGCAQPERARPAAATSAATGVGGGLPASDEAQSAITVLVSSASETDYCNGETMDSDGFRKTLTVAKRVTLPAPGASDTERVRAVIDAATTGMCQTVMRQLNYRIDRGTLHVPPVEGWAGVSIVMCWCRPQLDINLPRIPGVEHVLWDELDAPTAPR